MTVTFVRRALQAKCRTHSSPFAILSLFLFLLLSDEPHFNSSLSTPPKPLSRPPSSASPPLAVTQRVTCLVRAFHNILWPFASLGTTHSSHSVRVQLYPAGHSMRCAVMTFPQAQGKREGCGTCLPALCSSAARNGTPIWLAFRTLRQL